MSRRIQATTSSMKYRRFRRMQIIYDRREDSKACPEKRHKTANTNSQVRLGGWYFKGLARARGHRAGTDHVARHRSRRKTAERANEQTELSVGSRIGLKNDEWLAERPGMEEGFD